MRLALSHAAADTRRLARALATLWRGGDVVGLVGPLGAGKTTLIQGLTDALGRPEGVYVNSPTFTIMNTYPTTPLINHFDFYRLSDADELQEVGFYEAARSDALCLVEWMDALPEAWEAAQWRLTIREFEEGGRERELRLEALTPDTRARLAAWSSPLFKEAERA